jgi:hypothetical protein
MSIILAFKRAEDDKLMKFQRAAEFMRVPPDLTTATLCKYMVLHLLFPLHSWHGYVETESTLGGNRHHLPFYQISAQSDFKCGCQVSILEKNKVLLLLN